MIDFQACLFAAVDAVLIWEIPESDFAQAVHAQACLMAGINPDEVIGTYAD